MSEFVRTFETLAGGVLAAVYAALLIVETQQAIEEIGRILLEHAAVPGESRRVECV